MNNKNKTQTVRENNLFDDAAASAIVAGLGTHNFFMGIAS